MNPSEKCDEIDLKLTIPRKLSNIHNSILNHKYYDKLGELTKMQFEECVRSKNSDNNKFSRDLWFHLYHGKTEPYG